MDCYVAYGSAHAKAVGYNGNIISSWSVLKTKEIT